MSMMRDAAPTDQAHPRYVVWELTLKCDLACRHCGSRAGRPREEELSVEEAREVVDQLAALGTKEVTFIGGEAYLYPEWLEVVRAVAEAGMVPTLTTGARGVTPELCSAAAEAGLRAVSISIDGLEETHDQLRAVRGSWKRAIQAIGLVRDAGLQPYANTQWNKLNLPEVEDLAAILRIQGVRAWQVQITGPMGRAADREDWILQPPDMLDLIPRLAAIARAGKSEGFRVEASNNLGYFGPFEKDLRRSHWQGCKAGQFVMGIESNGDIKGCPSLPSAPYVGGNVREQSIAELWAHNEKIRFSRDRSLDELWGFCKSCYYAESCRGGCSWTAHTLLGKRGNMPLCYHRADMLKSQGKRERLIHASDADGLPFDFGRFDLVEEPWGQPGQ